MTKYYRRLKLKKLRIIKKLGGKCSKCGIDDVRVLDINHKDMAWKGRLKSLNLFFRMKDWLKNLAKNNLELLCANCHRIYTWKQRKYS